MSFISDAIGGSLAKPIEAAGNIAAKLMTTEKDKMDYDKAMAEMQTKIDAVEAANNSPLSSWRSGLGWVCAVCIALYYIPQFVIADYLWIIESLEKDTILPFPVEADSIFHLVCLLLGFGAYRSFEKVFKIR